MIKVLAPVFAATLAMTTAASALTITNKDGKEQQIGLDMGNSESVHKVPAGGSVNFKSECNDGCGVTGPWGYSTMLKTGDTWSFDGKSQVTIGTVKGNS